MQPKPEFLNHDDFPEPHMEPVASVSEAERLAQEIDGERYGDVAAELRRLAAEVEALAARPAAEARWYCLDRDGVAMLCKDEADARAQVIENDDLWPARAPHRAALLCDLECLRDGGDFIPLAQPRNEQAKRTAELCLSDWATARMNALEAENAALKREAYTWSKAAESYAADAERFRWLAERTAATGLARWVHPFQFLADAVDARRGLNRPPTPVGWSDTDWLKHLEEIRQNEAAYARGPLPERGWD